MNKKVLITGATGSIGKKITEALYKEGYKIFAVGRNEQKIKELSLKMPEIEFIQINLIDIDNIQKFLPNDIDILINCAGIYDYSKSENADNQKVKEIITLNLEVPLILSKLVIKNMKQKKWGRIINIGSISGSVGEACAMAYSASKAGLIGLTKSLALELAQDNITVNCINPGWVNSIMTDNSLTEQEKEETLEMIPQRRFIEPEEIADLCLYLTSDKAKGLTGQSINLCAGLSLG